MYNPKRIIVCAIAVYKSLFWYLLKLSCIILVLSAPVCMRCVSCAGMDTRQWTALSSFLFGLFWSDRVSDKQQQPLRPLLKMLSTADDETLGSGEAPLAGGHPLSIRTTCRHNGLRPILGPWPSSPESFYDNISDRFIIFLWY